MNATSDIVAGAMSFTNGHIVHSKAETPTEFTLFSHLPLEIRILIWNYSCFLRRNIDIWLIYLNGPLRGPFNNFQPHYFHSYNAVPGLLHACRDSRRIGLQHYVLGFGTHINIRGFVVSTPARIYVNPVADRLCEMQIIMDQRMLSHLYFSTKCRELGVTSNAWRISGDMDTFHLSHMRSLINSEPDLLDVILFDSRQSLDIKGTIEFEYVREGFDDVDEERKILFREVSTSLSDNDSNANIEPEWVESGKGLQTTARSPPQVRFAHVILDGERR